MKTGLVFRTSAVMRATEMDSRLIMHTLNIKSFFDLRTPDVAGQRGPYLTKFFDVKEAGRHHKWHASHQKITPMAETDANLTVKKSKRQLAKETPEEQSAAAAIQAYEELENQVFDWQAETAQYGAGAEQWGTLYLHSLIGGKFKKHVIKKAKKSSLLAAGFAASPAQQKYAICGPIFDRPEGLEILYRMIVEDCKNEINAVFQHFLEPDVMPVAFFCNHGKDRTGLTAAFIQTICGVKRETVVDGYQLSDFFLRPIGEIVDQEMRDAGMNPTIMSRTPSWVLIKTLSYIDRHYGGVDLYLDNCGFSLLQQKALRDKLVVFDELTPSAIRSAKSGLAQQVASRVRISIHRAGQLKAADVNGFSDPFVVVKLQRRPDAELEIVGRTEIVWMSLDPIWEYTCSFGPITAAASIVFDVWDYDHVGHNDFLGTCSIFFDSGEHPFTRIDHLKLDLHARSSSDKYVHGYILVSAEFDLPNSDAPSVSQ
jgi:hypothetical protein